MNRLLIVGAGGFGRELLAWLRAVEPCQDQWRLAGFLDASPHALDGFGVDLPVLGDPAVFVPQPGDLAACAIGNPQVKRRLIPALESRGCTFYTLIHSTAIVGPHCRIGRGSVLCPNAVVTTHVSLGDFVTLNVAATVGHDSTVGSWCTLNGHCDVTGHSTLEDGVLLGSHAVIVPARTVGRDSTVGAGSVVVRNVPPGCTVFGNPARVLK